jgi:microcystin-dependent protein
MADTINLGKIKGETGTVTPVGTILPWSQATAPNGFLKCDGSAVSRETYSALFEVIGTTYGSGNGSTTFNIPDLTSRTMVAANTTTTVGQAGGLNKVTPTLNQNLAATAPQVTGSVTANVTGNVAAGVGNLAVNAAALTGGVTANLGNLAGNTTVNGNPSNAQNLGTSVSQNLGGSSSSNIGGNLTGGVSNHTLSLSQIPSHAHGGGASGVIKRHQLNPEAANQTYTNPANTQAAGSNQAHAHGHNFAVAISGNVTTNVTGAVGVNVTGSATSAKGNLAGNATINGAPGITQNLAVTAATLDGAPSTTQNLGTSVTQNLGANAPQVTGAVAADQVSLFQPHLVVIYIIKT